ncbi:NAD(P)H-hydrate dehydratase [Arthrobacter sp. GCM10027362]|uniref:NAD(P)H-hydrate dehydratase n=1 Tax=Arthrobacter sp. GCM10027362 TaxID=3273379 RepID=UPI0036332CAC
MSTRAEPVTPAMLRSWPLSKDAASKDDRGTVLVVGGARRTPGAAMLTGLAALRAGAGRLTLAVAESAAIATAVAVPESGVIGLPENPDGSVRGDAASALADDLGAADVVVVGPGLDDADETATLLGRLAPLVRSETAIVLDAYALGVLVDLEDVYRQWAGRLVLTPNPTEALRLLGRDGVEMSAAVPEIAQKYQAVVTGQGIIADPVGGWWEVAAGNAGLGTSGSGDVLAGAVGGFLARKATPAQAACWGTYLHATAGDRLASAMGPLSFLARELLDAFPQVLAELNT